ncbi:hypothetical protein ZWY2020_046858 [Hordeum vulgare]|nr:hypothetical protein ZWY2020_046858 [Hordeum vulgare]
MFTNAQRQVKRTGRSGTPRDQYLQDLVTQFRTPRMKSTRKENYYQTCQILAYDPYNFSPLSPGSISVLLSQLNILELFLDCILEPNERLVELNPANASVITQCGGIPLVVQCLSSPVKNTVNSHLEPCTTYAILDKERDVEARCTWDHKDYSAAGAINSSFSNLANAFLDKHVHELALVQNCR